MNSNNPYGQNSYGDPMMPQGYSGYGFAAADAKKEILKRVFLYMFSGLIVTALIAGIGLSLPSVYFMILMNPWVITATIIIQLGVCIGFSIASAKVNPRVSRILFYTYSVISGISLIVFLSIYTMQSIVISFAAAAFTFGGMAFWGYRTKRDLTTVGIIGRMFLIGALVVSVLNFVLYFIAPGFASALNMLLNYVILAVFIGITAFDMQRIKKIAESNMQGFTGPEGAALIESISMFGALQLYLDFVNIFIRMLAIGGKRNN